MYILPALGYVGLALGFTFLTLSIASGLYYLSELVEEHSVLSSRVLRRLIYVIIVIQLLLAVVDSFPWYLTALGVISHAIYLTNLRHFPIVKLSDPLFILSCALVLVNHWVWFRWFSSPTSFSDSKIGFGGGRGRTGDRYSYGVGYGNQPSFTEIASYFGICVWFVPFALFVSLSAGENVLPSMGSEYATGEHRAGGDPGRGGFKRGHRRRNTGIAKATIGGVQQWVSETGAVMGLWKADNVKNI